MDVLLQIVRFTMGKLSYAGIGSRETPDIVKQKMNTERKGFTVEDIRKALET